MAAVPAKLARNVPSPNIGARFPTPDARFCGETLAVPSDSGLRSTRAVRLRRSPCSFRMSVPVHTIPPPRMAGNDILCGREFEAGGDAPVFRPRVPGDDTVTWGVAVAGTCHLRGEAARTLAYADTAGAAAETVVLEMPDHPAASRHLGPGPCLSRAEDPGGSGGWARSDAAAGLQRRV